MEQHRPARNAVTWPISNQSDGLQVSRFLKPTTPAASGSHKALPGTSLGDLKNP
jgi:hypothetical protein